MKDTFSVLVLCGVALGLISIVVFAGKDRGTFISPPEAVAEGFARSLIGGRYSRAIPYLSKELAAQTNEQQLHHLGTQLKTAGDKVLEVRGERLSVSDQNALAVAVVKTVNGERRLELQLVRESGIWSIGGFGAFSATDGGYTSYGPNISRCNSCSWDFVWVRGSVVGPKKMSHELFRNYTKNQTSHSTSFHSQ